MKPPQPVARACSMNTDDLNRFVSGECDSVESAGIEAHVASCAICANFVENRWRIRKALRTAVTADADASAELLAGMRNRLKDEVTAPPRRAMWQPLAMAAGIVLAATGAIGVAWLAYGDGSISAPVDRAAIRLAADAGHHVKCVEEMAGRVPPPTSNGGSLDADVAYVEAIVRERTTVGTTVAAAHRCTDGERRYVHVVLEREGALAGVLVSDGDGLPVIATASGASFTTGRHFVSVVSNSPAIDAAALAERLQPAMSEALM